MYSNDKVRIEMGEGRKDEILHLVIRALESGNLKFSFHALEQMEKREVSIFDVEEAIYRSSREVYKDDLRQNLKSGKYSWRYSLRGKNEVGDKDLRIIVTIEDPKTIVITVIDLNRNE